MKKTVTYYDIETDSIVTKDCVDIHFAGEKPTEFCFTPVDNPVRIYKQLNIYNPIVSISMKDGSLQIYVSGFQQIKSGGMAHTLTAIRIDE